MNTDDQERDDRREVGETGIPFASSELKRSGQPGEGARLPIPPGDVDRWLDDGLAQYAKAEPRVGLEGRVLARLAGAREESRRTLRWSAWTFGAAFAMALALLWLGGLDRRPVPQAPVAKVAAQAGRPISTDDRSSADAGAHEAAKHVFVAGRGESAHGEVERNRFGGQRPAQEDVAGTEDASVGPKLDQFPSPSPLTDQERMLVRYVQDFPQKAQLMARAQTELRKQDELEMAAPWPAKAAQGSEERPE